MHSTKTLAVQDAAWRGGAGGGGCRWHLHKFGVLHTRKSLTRLGKLELRVADVDSVSPCTFSHKKCTEKCQSCWRRSSHSFAMVATAIR